MEELKEKLKDYFARSVYAIPVLTAVLVLTGFLILGAYSLYKNKPKIDNQPVATNTSEDSQEAEPAEATVVPEPTQEQKTDEIKKNPPKTSSGNLSSKAVSTSSGQAVVVSTGAIGDSSSTKIQDYADDGPVSNFVYIDNTGQYPSLGNTIKEYLNSTLLHGSEVAYMYELDVIDCASCNYGGYWTGSYIYSGSDITKAYGYITLNVAQYKSSSYFEDYMKLIFAHEYGHHYSMYYRWVKLDIPTGQRFPSSYYTVRPLSYSTTAVDYSLGWENCDAEVVAEDYSYFYSTYGYSGIASVHGYPSAATRTWFTSLSGAVAPTVPQSEPEPETPADSTAPTVSVTSPANGSTVSGSVQISASASDNVAISRVDFYVDDSFLASDSSSPYQAVWESGSSSNSTHSLKARAYDSSDNNTTASINVIVNNAQSADTTKPQVSISAPASDPFAWLSGDLTISASSSDDVAVTRIEFYINNTLVASENRATIARIWIYASTPAASYVLKAKAYDAAGNSAETSLTINKS